jgi:hypothetical protein
VVEGSIWRSSRMGISMWSFVSTGVGIGDVVVVVAKTVDDVETDVKSQIKLA